MIRIDHHFCVLLAACIIGSHCLAAPSSEQRSDKKAVVVLKGPDVDAALMGEICNNISKTYRCSVRRVDLPSGFRALKSEKQESILVGIRKPNSLCLIAVVNIPDRKGLRSAKYPKICAALMNVAVLNDVGGADNDSRARFISRAKREGVRIAGRLLQVPVCMNPRCAMRKPEADAQRDSIGTNLCPPCSRTASALLSKQGALLNFLPGTKADVQVTE